MNSLDAIKQTAGRFASVTYTNKEGNTKTYTIRTGVRKYAKGVGKAKVPNSVTVFCIDLANRGYKTFIQSGIKKVRCGRVSYTTMM
jgi:hypothetical protein